MYRILVPVDYSVERATKQAEYVTDLPCADSEVEAVLGHTLEPEDREAPDSMQQVERVETVKEATDILEEAGVATDALELSSPPRDGILTAARELGADEIVMSGKKRSPAQKAILGSVTQSVILNSSIPVTVVNTPQE